MSKVGKGQIQTVEELTSIFRRAGDFEAVDESTLLLGQAFYLTGRPSEARDCFEAILRMEGEETEEGVSPQLESRTRLALATLLAHDERDLTGGMEMLDSLVDDPDIGNLEGIVQIERGYCLYHMSQVSKAEQVIRRGLSFARGQKQRGYIARGLQYLGMALAHQAEEDSLEEACHHLLEGAKLARNKPGLLAQIADSLGRVYSRLGKYEMATRWLQNSLKYKEDIGDRTGMAISYGGLGETHLRAGQYDEAIKAHKSNIELVQNGEGGEQVGVGRQCCLLAECYRRKGDLKRAEVCLKKAEREAEKGTEMQRSISKAYVDTYRGRLKFGGGENALALRLFQQAESGFQQVGYETFLPAVRQGMGQTQIALGNLDEAERALLWAEEHESDPYEQFFIFQSLAELARAREDQEEFDIHAARARFLAEKLNSPPLQAQIPSPRSGSGRGERQIEVVSGVPKIAFVGETLDVRLLVRDGAGTPQPNAEIQFDESALADQGGHIAPAARVRTGSKGTADAKLILGRKEGRIGIEIQVIGASANIEMRFLIYNMKVERTPGCRIPDHAEPLLKQMFFNLTRNIQVDETLPVSEALTFMRVLCVCTQGYGSSRKVRPLIKIGPAEEIVAERDAFNSHLEQIPSLSSPVIMANAVQDDFASIAYLLPTRNQALKLSLFMDYLQGNDYSSIRSAIDNLFKKNLSGLHRRFRVARGVFSQTYGGLEEQSTREFWVSLKEWLPNLIQEVDESRIVIKFPDRIESLGLLGQYRRFVDAERMGLQSDVQGGMRSESMLVDQQAGVWVTDWGGHGKGHLYSDFIALEVDIRWQALLRGELNMGFEEWFQREVEGLDLFEKTFQEGQQGGKRSETLAAHFHPDPGKPTLNKIFFAVHSIRKASMFELNSFRMDEYIEGLFCHTVRRLQEVETSHEASMLLALAVAISTFLDPESGPTY